ncbi:nucleotidyltransferase domain-containing protein [Winogradskya humida]|uniref:Nucleotidyltransferase n=1 Tax=Winogradskya humida TaxID=113566 RepID=A0ABQ3ZQU1_9ACTN|nr:nucleotidyltransferase domain-containing protein [Actinoplanes humidus]GIE20858.1 nucleotidyltransferase [Actinoplanes humidus]
MSRTSRVRAGQGCGPVQEPNAFLLSWAQGVLDDALRRSPLLAARPYEIFAQGSRVNGTYLEQSSDIDLVLMLTAPASSHDWEGFRDDVLGALGETYTVRMGRRCLNVDDQGSLFGEMVDILVATEHRFSPVPGAEFYEQGVFFRDVEGRPIVNYPKQHRRNGDEKDLRTGGRFKQVVRAAKRARKLAGDDTPSYLIECLLFNVPDAVYRTSTAYRGAFDWLSRCYHEDPVVFAELPCQNGINRLFGPGPDQWEPAAAGRIIDVLHTL